MKEDGESAYCQYTILHFHWTPSQFNSLSRKEKAIVMDCIDNQIMENERINRSIKNGKN